MKTVLLTLGAALVLATLIGCNNHQSPQQYAALEPMRQSYSGLMPCGQNCRDSESSLFLAADGSYVLEQREAGAKGMRFAQYGKWARTADTLTLVAMNGEKKLFRPTEEGLEVLSVQGLPVTHQQHYHLTARSPQPAG
ncbi:copper resistance protein NlpE N-terminal domain-containing protein [Erwinia sp. SLM-02]|uniref:copper resistance protein NlpE N-terminal domain-containing protein n=1 Tax=Erwinia sp. SLM-02 TaxID=3020057 RepID=UPI00308077C8